MNRNKLKYIGIPFIAFVFVFLLINIVNYIMESNISKNSVLQDVIIQSDINYNKEKSNYDQKNGFKEGISKLYAKLEYLLGKDLIKDYYLIDNNWIMPTPIDEYSNEDIKYSANEINRLAKTAKEKGKDVYYASVPHKENALSYLYKNDTDGVGNAEANKNKLEHYIDKRNTKFIDVDNYFFNEFKNHQLEEMYFKTDENWNGFGAFEGFKYIIGKMDIEVDINSSNYTMANISDGHFLGSYNKILNQLVDEDESIPYIYHKKNYRYKYFNYNGKRDIEVNKEDVIASGIKDNKILYSGAYTFDNNYYVLKIKNEDALSDKKIIIFKDSYQSPTSWVFADIFKEVQLVDPRNLDKNEMSCSDILENSDADIVLFMYNTVDFKIMIDEMIK